MLSIASFKYLADLKEKYAHTNRQIETEIMNSRSEFDRYRENLVVGIKEKLEAEGFGIERRGTDFKAYYNESTITVINDARINRVNAYAEGVDIFTVTPEALPGQVKRGRKGIEHNDILKKEIHELEVELESREGLLNSYNNENFCYKDQEGNRFKSSKEVIDHYFQ